MLRAVAILVALVVACGRDETSLQPGTVQGELGDTATTGDAYVFLFDPGEGPPRLPGPPRYATAIPAERLESGQRRFVFAGVTDAPYRLWGFVDVDRNLETSVDLLAQPSAGDVPLAATEVTTAGVTTLQALVATQAALEFHPPVFSVANAGASVLVPDLPLSPVSFTLQTEGIGPFDAARGGFVVSLADTNRDGQPEDLNGDGVPDLYPQAFLRFLARPGQTVPLNTDGTAAEVIVPLLYLPQEFLTLLAGDPAARIVTSTLSVFVIPQALAVFSGEGGGRFTTALEAVPVGAYELVVIAETGQTWRVPNALATDAADRLGGPYPSQRTTFTVFHGSSRQLLPH